MENEDSVIWRSLFVANMAHFRQVRKRSGIPYISHPMEVMKLISVWGVDDEDILSAAICHDILEDSDMKVDDLILFLNQRIASLVSELTCYGDKEDYIKSFINKSAAAIVIKCADRLCNIKDFAQFDIDKAIAYYQQTLPVFNLIRYNLEEDVTENINYNFPGIAIHIKNDISSIWDNLMKQKSLHS
jgi:GTP pyrophosphokinase